ncbi:MAG: SH3 domain-containing protein, partial [Clostridia bacterium]|nr:SH3 domain-containing protein [Clostridia bacterium]
RSSTTIAAGGTYRVTASRLNVRSSASSSSAIKGTLASGTSVTVTRLSGNWAYVTYRGGEGWVYTSYLG